MSYKDRKQLVDVLENVIRGLHIQSTVFPEVPPMVVVSDRLTFGWGITENYTNLSISFHLFTRKRWKQHCSLIIDLLMLEAGDLLYSFKAFKYGTRAELDSLLADKLESMLAYLKDQTTYPSGTYFTGIKDKNYEELVLRLFTNLGFIQLELLGLDGTDLHVFQFELVGSGRTQVQCSSKVFRGFNIVNNERSKELLIPLRLDDRNLRGYLLDLVSNIRKREYVVAFLLGKDLN